VRKRHKSRIGASVSRTKRRCRLLRETPFPSIYQKDALYSGIPRNHERAQNKPPDCKTRTAAPTGIGSGGKSEELDSASKSETYSSESLAARFPIIAAHVGFGDTFEVAA
jgi:hypothetical protein